MNSFCFGNQIPYSPKLQLQILHRQKYIEYCSAIPDKEAVPPPHNVPVRKQHEDMQDENFFLLFRFYNPICRLRRKPDDKMLWYKGFDSPSLYENQVSFFFFSFFEFIDVNDRNVTFNNTVVEMIYFTVLQIDSKSENITDAADTKPES